ncbi:MAG: Smr/MutS family protein [Luteibaculaceae bacterium]
MFAIGEKVQFKDKKGFATILVKRSEAVYTIETDEGFLYDCPAEQLAKIMFKNEKLEEIVKSKKNPIVVRQHEVSQETKIGSAVNKAHSLPADEFVKLIQKFGVVDKDKSLSKQKKETNAKIKKDKELPSVDLHTYELIESESGLTNTEIVEIQLAALKRYLDECTKKKRKKFIVIHGKGQGVLRSLVRNYLAENYPNADFFDADYSKWGSGATQVEF